jgi:bacterioferritin-associated ferredoxin
MDFGVPQSLIHDPVHAESHRVVCHCLNVTEHEIRETITENDPQSIRGVSQACGAGAGCMSCHRHIRRMLNEHVVQRRMQMVGEAIATEPACAGQPSCGS